jgi:hypothetical protein
MSKLELLKVYVKNYVSVFKKAVELLGLLKNIFVISLRKDYLMQYSVVEELKEAFEQIELRARPLSKEMIEDFEKKAFSEVEFPKHKIDFVKDEHYQNPDTKDLTKGWSGLGINVNPYTGKIGEIKDE